MLYVANVDEGVDEVPDGGRRARERRRRASRCAISARIEVELGELDDDAEAAEMRAELGISESGLARLIARGLRAARPDRRSSPPARTRRRWRAALRRGLDRLGGRRRRSTPRSSRRSCAPRWSAGRTSSTRAATRRRATAGLLRTEGRSYVVADGDVIHIKT